MLVMGFTNALLSFSAGLRPELCGITGSGGIPRHLPHPGHLTRMTLSPGPHFLLPGVLRVSSALNG